MNKIEEIEKLLKKWEAAKKHKEGFGFENNAYAIGLQIKGLKAALNILKQPSNTRMQTVACNCPMFAEAVSHCFYKLKDGSCDWPR
jgi:hypothetical protein